jgi:hypothetical protein
MTGRVSVSDAPRLSASGHLACLSPSFPSAGVSVPSLRPLIPAVPPVNATRRSSSIVSSRVSLKCSSKTPFSLPPRLKAPRPLALRPTLLPQTKTHTPNPLISYPSLTPHTLRHHRRRHRRVLLDAVRATSLRPSKDSTDVEVVAQSPSKRPRAQTRPRATTNLDNDNNRSPSTPASRRRERKAPTNDAFQSTNETTAPDSEARRRGCP